MLLLYALKCVDKILKSNYGHRGLYFTMYQVDKNILPQLFEFLSISGIKQNETKTKTKPTKKKMYQPKQRKILDTNLLYSSTEFKN